MENVTDASPVRGDCHTEILSENYSQQDVTMFKDYGLSLDRMKSLISQTIEKEEKIAYCTLRVAWWIRRFHTDQKARYVFEGFAYGFDWDAERTSLIQTSSKLRTRTLTHKVTLALLEKYIAKRKMALT